MVSVPSTPDRVRLAHLPTPFRLLENLSKRIGGPSIWLKSDDQTGSALSGNKVRKLEFLLADAINSGADTIITCGGLQSNHCRATALACAQLGLKCVLLLREGDYPRDGGLVTSKKEGNLLLDSLSGARVHIIGKAEYQGKLSSLFSETEQRLRADGAVPYRIPTGGSNGLGLWGYLSAGMELHQDFEQAGISPQAIVCATGSGGTQTGLSLANFFWPDKDRAPQIIGMAVCDSADYFNRKGRRDARDWCEGAKLSRQETETVLRGLQINTLDQYIGPGYATPYPEALQTILQLAQEEGVVLDPVYTGKAFHGLLNEIQHGRFQDMKDIVFVHTGGIFGLFPYSSSLVHP